MPYALPSMRVTAIEVPVKNKTSMAQEWESGRVGEWEIIVPSERIGVSGCRCNHALGVTGLLSELR